MIGVAFYRNELIVLDMKNHGTRVWAVMRAAPMIGLD
jgi:hypothetical protein